MTDVEKKDNEYKFSQSELKKMASYRIRQEKAMARRMEAEALSAEVEAKVAQHRLDLLEEEMRAKKSGLARV